jgi:HNH endonuclease
MSVGNRLRFEVFKRDKFTCQYCGSKAPNVVLNCDHVHSVKEGGKSEILNLITSCFDCNSGKGSRLLSDGSIVDRQHTMLSELQARREQIEMMIEWRKGLVDQETRSIDAIDTRYRDRTGFSLNQQGRAIVERWLKRHTVLAILSALDRSCAIHLRFVGDEATEASAAKAFELLPRVVSMEKQEAEKPYIPRLLYIQGILRKRTGAKRYDCIGYLEHLHLCGLELDDLERKAKRVRTMDDFEEPLDDWLAQIGKPF